MRHWACAYRHICYAIQESFASVTPPNGYAACQYIPLPQTVAKFWMRHELCGESSTLGWSDSFYLFCSQVPVLCPRFYTFCTIFGRMPVFDGYGLAPKYPNFKLLTKMYIFLLHTNLCFKQYSKDCVTRKVFLVEPHLLRRWWENCVKAIEIKAKHCTGVSLWLCRWQTHVNKNVSWNCFSFLKAISYKKFRVE